MYIVIEIQTDSSGKVSTLVYQFTDRLQADAKFHTILAAAAVSALPIHAAVIMTNTGTMVKSEFYRHGGEE